MNGASRRFIAISLIIIIVAVLSGVAVTSALGAVNETKVHQNSKDYQSKTCNDCHDYLSRNESTDRQYLAAHRRHFLSVFLNFFDSQGGVDYGCAKCHQETTPPTYYEGNTSVTKPDAENELNREVRPGVCIECHGMFRTTKHKFDGVEYDYVALRTECTSCHNPDGPGLRPEDAHGAAPLESSSSIDPFTAGVWWINQRYANTKSFCSRCHGGLAWFQVEETNPGIGCGYDLCHKTSPSSFLNTSVAEFLLDTTFTGSHAIHFDSTRGPGITSCETCHGTGSALGNHTGHKNDTKNFAGGDLEDLNATAVCDTCHSPGGSFNGVDSTTDSIGAKNSWTSGVYDTPVTLTIGKEKWCVGCHDSDPPTINGQAAKKMGGDNINYGYFKSGHGLDSGSKYDDDAIDDANGNPGGEIDCVDCHDLSKTHLTGADDTNFDGQRLSSTVNGTTTPSIQRICEGCHQNKLGSLSATRQVSTHGNDTAGGYTDVLEEPFSIECKVCHEVHGNNYAGGSRNLKMVRTNFGDYNDSTSVVFTSSSGTDSYDESDTVGIEDSDDLCATCHITDSASNPGYDTSKHAGGHEHASMGDQRGNDCTTCHQHNYLDDATVTPSDGFMPGGGCDLCHTFPPGGTQGTYKGSATHDVHVDTYGYECITCHNDYPLGHNESAVSSEDDWEDKFEPENVDVVFSPLNPLGETTVTTTTDILNALGRGYDTNRQCQNTYCHGQSGTINGKSFALLGGTNQSGGIPTWDDGNATSPTATFAITKLSGDCGTCHDTTADNQAQGGTFWPIWDTTDSQNDWTDTTQPVVYDVTSGSSIGSGATQIAHRTHLDKLRGPKESCNQCHKTPPTVTGSESPGTPSTHINQTLDFLDGENTIAATNACDYCHAPNGPYDGVNSTSISVGAKDNWATGVYLDDGRLVPAKEKWCVGCHDDPGSYVKEVTATPVNGDSVTYGFYPTGHGQKNMVKCTDCHDLELEHIDGEPRTYTYTGSGQTPQDYREGYRLQLVDGEYPMVVPLRSTSDVDTQYRLCVKCHNQDSIYSSETTPGSNFVRTGGLAQYSGVGPSAPGNSHVSMTYPGTAPTAVIWNSDWDDNTDDSPIDAGFDSRVSCVTCHNPHGSKYPAMIRDGKIDGKNKANGQLYDGLEFSYVTTGTPWVEPYEIVVPDVGTFTVSNRTGTSAGATKENSIGAVLRFAGENADQRSCTTAPCHGSSPPPLEDRVAEYPSYQIDDDPFSGSPNLIDFYRKVVPVITSALYTSDTTVSVVFTESVNAALGDFTDMQGSSGALTKLSISGSGTAIIEIKIGSTSDTTGSLDLTSGITSVANGTPLSPVDDQFIWDGRD